MELKECYTHGVFRGPRCPECGNVSKLLMEDREIDSLGKVLAGMLRHFPERYGVRLDEHGWIGIQEIVNPIRIQRRHFEWLTPHHIEAMAKTDQKQRYQVNEHREIRARYGHTIPVNMDDLPTEGIPDKLYYQTTPEEKEFIMEAGISPSDKTWIHLSKTYRQAYISGLFHVDEPEVIEINVPALVESGMPVYMATDEIFLVSLVPEEFIRLAEREDVTVTPEEQEEIERVKENRERRKNFSSYDNS